jgi:hypothetical protein
MSVIEVLEASIKKHGDKALTTGHLLNILRYAERKATEQEHRDWMEMSAYGIDPND